MPWLEVNKLELRKIFVLRLLRGEKMTDLCKEYGISRPTGYKFPARFKECGFQGLSDLSRKPHLSPNKVDPFVEQLIIDLKGDYITWGPKKLKARLETLYPGLKTPAASTIGAVLDRNGLVASKTRRIKRAYSLTQLSDSNQPNDIWCIDYKGQFRTKDNIYCYPLTISDHFSRFLIACEALQGTGQDEAFAVFKRSFATYGLPNIIRSDNGSPFCSSSKLYGLTRLSAWFLSLGIKLERIDPGHPEQNARHERMHRTLKHDAINPPANNILQQQEYFENYVKIFNFERPHEALDQQTPGVLYKNSERNYREQILEYPYHDLSKKVDFDGFLFIDSKRQVRISKVLYGYYLGLKEQEKEWLVTFAKYDIGVIYKDTLEFETMEILDL